MAETLVLLEEQVQRCTCADSKSFQVLRQLMQQIVHEIGQHYRAGDGSTVLFDILQRFQQAELHLKVFKPAALDAGNGEHYKRAFDNAKVDTLYLITLLRSAIRFGHLVPIVSEQNA